MGGFLSQNVEKQKGPIRSRFTLDSCPTDVNKEMTYVPSDSTTKYTFPLIGYKDLRERDIRLEEFFTKENILLSELFEYLPQYPLRLISSILQLTHPTEHDTLYYLSYKYDSKNNSVKWTKETYGTTWPTVIKNSSVYTYDPILKYNIRKLSIRDMFIYDTKTLIPNTVGIVFTDTNGNRHKILPYMSGKMVYQYGIFLNIHEDCYLDDIEKLLDTMRRRLGRKGISIKLPGMKPKTDNSASIGRPTIEIPPENKEGAIGDVVGDDTDEDCSDDEIGEDVNNPLDIHEGTEEHSPTPSDVDMGAGVDIELVRSRSGDK